MIQVLSDLNALVNGNIKWRSGRKTFKRNDFVNLKQTARRVKVTTIQYFLNLTIQI